VLALGALEPAAFGAPFVPSDESQVLERLPPRTGREWQAIASLRAQLAREPRSATVAAELARRYLELFRAEGEPRLVAYAQSALAPWRDERDPPLEIAQRRAEIAQSEHRFDDALADLKRVIERDPRSVAARLTVASIDLVRADYDASRRECARLVLLADAAVAGACSSAVRAMTGEAGDAYQYLTRSLAEPTALPPELRVWIETLAAETSETLGAWHNAEAHYRAALASGERERPSVYLLAAYADFLLRGRRPDEALALLKDAPPADPLTLRIAVAEKQLGRLEPARVESLSYRLQLALDGLDTTHAREAAYFALYVLDKPELALERALTNWNVQREPIDARLVLESALAAHRAADARPVLDWLASSGCEHVDLQRLERRLGS
jgi:tetratricopeptide (TPR) repeat protein